MTESTPQSPIGSGFTAATTAAEVVTNFDFGGNSVIVTGGYSGLGFEVVKWVAYGQAKTANSLFAAGWMDDAGTVNERFKSTEQGAATTVWAATSVALDGLGGVYLEDVDVALPTEIGSPEARIRGVDAHAIDRDAAARLWAVSAELTGLNVFA